MTMGMKGGKRHSELMDNNYTLHVRAADGFWVVAMAVWCVCPWGGCTPDTVQARTPPASTMKCTLPATNKEIVVQAPNTSHFHPKY